MGQDANQIMAPYKKLHAIAVMDEPRSISEKILFPRRIIKAFTGNVWVPTPNPSIADVTTHADTVDEKQNIVFTRLIGAAAARNIAYDVVKLDLNCWKAQVQMIADNNPQNAVAIIESCGFKVKHVPEKSKKPLVAKNGAAPNTALLVARALGKRVSYEWQQSTDGSHWEKLPKSTTVAHITATGINPATLYYFRYRGITNKVEGNWSDPVAFIHL
jgi:hypothetical protein